MVTTGLLSGPGKLPVTFELPAAIWADQVWLCGDFNQWDPHATPMAQDRVTGAWRVTLELDVGQRYEFRYLLGPDDWITDCSCGVTVPNPFGSRNSIVDLSGLLNGDQGPIQPSTNVQSSVVGAASALAGFGLGLAPGLTSGGMHVAEIARRP
ncbi:MAG: isoamylase early set domain-containing protein [Chloroflexota bacterium]